MASTYTYKLSKASELSHFILSSEKEHGIQTFIFKDCVKIREEYASHGPLVDTLYAERPEVSKDIVLLQVAHPGKSFAKYADDKHKIALTLGAYLELLKFFRGEYSKLMKRIDTDIKNMTTKSEWMMLNPFISFRGPADILFKQVLDATGKFSLDLHIYKEWEQGTLSMTLAYSDEKMGSIPLPLAPMKQLARDLPTISSLVDYKETSPNKRHRQS